MSEIRKLETREEAQAFMLFLCSERNRHLKDVADIEHWLRILRRKWGLDIPWTYEAWVDLEGNV